MVFVAAVAVTHLGCAPLRVALLPCFGVKGVASHEGKQPSTDSAVSTITLSQYYPGMVRVSLDL